MTIDTQKLLNLFDTAAQAHGWASDQGTRAQAQTALANYQRTRGDLEQALDAQAAEIARLREALWVVAEHNALHFGESHNTVIQARALLSRYSSDRPAEVRCNHCGWFGADVDLVRDVAADEPEDGAADVCPQCKRIGDLQDIGLPAASAEPDPANEHAAFEAWRKREYPWTSPATDGMGIVWDAWMERARRAAPVAQEPVATTGRTHSLKTDPEVFQAVFEGLKTFEIRVNDRGFRVGDELLLKETTRTGAEIKDGAPLEYTGRTCRRAVSHILTGYGLAENWCCLSFAAPVATQAQDERWKQSAARDPLAYAAGYSDGAKNALDITAQAQPCDHVYEAWPIDGSRRASAPFEAVCRKCGARAGVSLKLDMQRESQRGAESGRDRKDAERWKWLKTEAKGHDFDNLSIRLPEQMDAYADAARAAKERT